MSPTEAFGIALILVACAAPVIVIGVVYYLKKRLEHTQIIAAIEKGTPLSELKPPKQNGALWIRNLTLGIAFLAIGLAFLLAGPGGDAPASFMAFIFGGLGLAWLIRGFLYRKHPPQTQPSAKSNAAENKAKLVTEEQQN